MPPATREVLVIGCRVDAGLNVEAGQFQARRIIPNAQGSFTQMAFGNFSDRFVQTLPLKRQTVKEQNIISNVWRQLLV